jgi:isopenicillin N synthase-like dioxygenase
MSIDVVDISQFLTNKNDAASKEACKKLAQILKETSCVIIKDPRVSEEHNSKFLDMMERYYNQPDEQKMKDVFPELNYSRGTTPEFVEIPRDHSQTISNLKPENAAHVPKGADPKWRYFWRVGEIPKNSKFPGLNYPPLIPDNFPEWGEVMNNWAKLMLESIQTVAEMLAIGLELPSDCFLKRMQNGPHSLAPTGSNLGKYNSLDTIFAGFHYDLNFLTIHGKSRFPGLFIWLRNGTRILVKVPDGCLLVQAGKQLEWFTGGEITAGFHEVVVCPETLEALERAKSQNRPPWRVSSTFFGHIGLDEELRPLEYFENTESMKKYPPTLAGDQVMDELKKINLAAKK